MTHKDNEHAFLGAKGAHDSAQLLVVDVNIITLVGKDSCVDLLKS
jgi:hypothetical protein